MSSTKRGAISEIYAAAYLMEIGFEVFRAISPSANPDLVAIRGKQILQIEVKSGIRLKSGHITFDSRGTATKTVAVVLSPLEVVFLRKGRQIRLSS
jgi:Holliday junction resolvase